MLASSSWSFVTSYFKYLCKLRPILHNLPQNIKGVWKQYSFILQGYYNCSSKVWKKEGKLWFNILYYKYTSQNTKYKQVEFNLLMKKCLSASVQGWLGHFKTKTSRSYANCAIYLDRVTREITLPWHKQFQACLIYAFVCKYFLGGREMKMPPFVLLSFLSVYSRSYL